MCALVFGCSSGIRWRGYTFDRVHAEGQRDGKLTFVYFRHWSVVACTTFEEDVLKEPAVLQATAALYCVPLDFHWDRPLADRWGIPEPPGVVILDPEGRARARLSGEISVEQLLDAIRTAQNESVATTQPMSPP